MRALKRLIRQEYGGALLMDPRTGKTKTAIDWFCILFLKGKIDRGLIICPNHVIDVWEQQLKEHCPYEYDVIMWDRWARKKQALPEPRKNCLLFVLVNYEAFSTPGSRLPSGRRSRKNGRIRVRDDIRRWANRGKAVAALDESHHIQRVSGHAARTIVTLHRDFPHRLLMTGTPITKANKAHGIWMQWKFLCPWQLEEWEDYTDFKEYFGRWIEIPDVPVKVWKRPRHMKEFQELLSRDSFSVARDECFDLPPSDVQRVPVGLMQSARVYDDMAEHMVAEIASQTAEASYPIVKILRLCQITGGFVTSDEGKIIRVGSEKLLTLDPILDNCMDNQEKVIIVARFKPELDALYKLAKSHRVPVYQIRGGIPRQQVGEEMRKSRRYKGPLIYVVQPHSAAHGIDLSFSARMIWYSLTPNFVHYSQTCDRIALSRESTTFTYLLAQDTVDEVLYDVLQTDGRIVRAVKRAPERLLRV
ncbi:MAG: SNF2-related protein [Pseudonocardiaceae bacterium]